MKTNIFFLIVILFNLCVTIPCYAQRATTNEARIVALAYLGRDTLQWGGRVARVNVESDNRGIPLMYEVIMNDSTIVLVSGTKATNPILATYECANGLGIFETDVLPCGLAVIMDFYRQAIAFIAENNVRAENNDEWEQLLNAEWPHSQRTSVGPLLTTQWGQSWSNDSTERYAYNKFTPSGIGCQHCLAGCVAVSMGQVMNYYKHPIVTCKIMDFSEQFDWCHMPDKLMQESPLFKHECEAISRLLYTCGEMIEIRYGCGGSGGENSSAIEALKSVFKYSTDAKILKREHSYLGLLNSFLDTVKMSLNMGYPVIMGAYDRDDNGHSFVCDGYSDNHYHFNWGWNGMYNGYYSFSFIVGNINVGDYTFTHDFDAIVFLHPEANSPSDICTFEMHLEDFYTDYYITNNHHPFVFKPYDNTP